MKFLNTSNSMKTGGNENTMGTLATTNPKSYSIMIKLIDKKDLNTEFEHVCYEINMLVGLTCHLMKVSHFKDYIMQNAILESWLLHFRCLVDFLTGNTKKIDDIKIRTFNVDEYNKNEIIDENLYNAINKRLTHITSKRTSETKNWDYFNMYIKLANKYNDFINKLCDGNIILKTDINQFLIPSNELELKDFKIKLIN